MSFSIVECMYVCVCDLLWDLKEDDDTEKTVPLVKDVTLQSDRVARRHR